MRRAYSVPADPSVPNALLRGVPDEEDEDEDEEEDGDEENEEDEDSGEGYSEQESF
jgi:hypothetical protein